jgi:photosystem II stability/assembly factor-like uncharacterized protein
MNRRWPAGLMLSLMCSLLFSWSAAHADRFDRWRWVNPLPQGHILHAVAYGNKMFAAVGLKGTIITSADGHQWIKRSSRNTGHLYSIVYANNMFMAVGQGGAIVTSTDGIHWITRSTGSVQNLYGIAYGNNTFVVVGNSGTLLTSRDGQDSAYPEPPTICAVSPLETVHSSRAAEGPS